MPTRPRKPAADPPSEPPPEPGLCASCIHAQPIRSGRGSVFWRCGRAATDASYAKFPRLPVTFCEGLQPG